MVNRKYFLIFVLLLAALLRLWGLSRGDPVNDEVFYAFRGLGLIDFDEAEAQTTPWEWFDPAIPFWARISWHDHPPLVFWIQHLFLLIFGESNFAFRLPSALLGILSVWLLYLVGRRLYGSQVGILAALILAATLNHVYISRVGMQEAYVIFFLLAASYLFLRSLGKDTYLIWTGIALGLGLLVKYSSFVLVPIFLGYLLFFKREYFGNRKFWLAAALVLLILTPVIVYNFKLYQRVGHFDFQLSYIFGNSPEYWKVAPGKEIGTLYERFRSFVPRLVASNSWFLLSGFVLALAAFWRRLFEDFRGTLARHAFLLFSFLFLVVLLLFIGPSFRFLTMLGPFIALAVSLLSSGLYEKFFVRREKLAFIFLSLFLIFEIFYSFNNQIRYYPSGPAPWFSSKVRYENYNWGYNELGEFWKKELEEKMPELTFQMRYKFLEDLQEESLADARREKLEPYPALIVTYGNFDRGAKLWVLDRLHIYHAWPIISFETYLQYLQKNGLGYYERSGFRHYYFITTTNFVPAPYFQELVKNAAPTKIYNKRNGETFRIYKLSTTDYTL